MKRSTALLAVSALAAATLLLPLAVPGRAADDVSETRSVSGFTKIRLQGAFTTKVTAGASATSVVVTGAPDLVSRVTTEVRDGTLVVGMRDRSGLFSRSPKLIIAVPALRAIANEGAGNITIAGVGGGDLDIENAGAATIVASGRAQRESISLNGTGKIDVTAVRARDVTVDNNGVGGVYVRASGTLTMNVNGVGEIRYAGDPTHVQSSVNGVGRIGRM